MAAVLGMAVAAPPALAHIEVSADKAAPGATNVVVTFTAESESASAGITGITVQLPSGITSGEVALRSGPRGWVLKAMPDGYEVHGPAMAPGADAEYSIIVARLPQQSPVVFKSIQSYSDGRQDAWIETSTDAAADLAMPAPAIVYGGAPQTHSGHDHGTSSTGPAAEHDGSATANGAAVFGIGSGVIVALVFGAYGVIRRRRGATVERANR